MSEDTKKSGVVASVDFISKSEKGWKRYDVSFENGDAIRAFVPNDCDHEISVGENLAFLKGRWNSWVLDRKSIPGGGGGENTSASTKSTSKSYGSNGRISSSNDYWKQKYQYEVEHKDPRLEFQGHGNRTGGIYEAMIGGAYANGAPVHEMSPEEFDTFCMCADALIDSCFAKTKEVFRRINKKDVDETPNEES